MFNEPQGAYTFLLNLHKRKRYNKAIKWLEIVFEFGIVF